MPESPGPADPVSGWIEALERRHRRDLTFQEVRKGLQALSSLYVERRQKIASGSALEGAGKRAAFALYYGPMHFLLVRAVLQALGPAPTRPRVVLDLGCGTGAAGAAWALLTRAAVEGIDRSGWAVEEAQWTYGRLGLRGSARKDDAAAMSLPGGTAGVVAAFTVNELDPEARALLLTRFRAAATGELSVLVVEPLARRALTWWNEWADVFAAIGGRQDEWRPRLDIPPSVAELGR
ncbi:MAG: methyltransferase domain-containing protein, partial [Gemmatimonadales bacterium]